MNHILSERVDPPGFVRLVVAGRTTLLVPTDVAEERAKASQQTFEKEEALRLEEGRRREREVKTEQGREQREEAAKALARHVERTRPPRPGWHRVLPNLVRLEHEVTDARAMDRSADREINERRKRIVMKLLDRGPDRMVAMPQGWRQSVDELESALPHFRQPIRTLRNALALAEATGSPPRIAPQLLLGPPGVGKTYFSNRVAELLGTARGSVQFDQPGAGAQLRGSDKYWANSEPGLLFNLVCLGAVANPVLLLDELDKAGNDGRQHGNNQLAQLHGALERETAQSIRDISLDIEFDASLVTYIGTANSLRGVGAPIISRMDVCVIEPPTRREAFDIAASIGQATLVKLKLDDDIEFERGALALLSELSPRQMMKLTEQAVAAAVVSGRTRISEQNLWAELSGGVESRMH